MQNIFYFIIIIVVVGLIGFICYTFLSKIPDKKGTTRVKLFITILNKFLHIEYESEHENNTKK